MDPYQNPPYYYPPNYPSLSSNDYQTHQKLKEDIKTLNEQIEVLRNMIRPEPKEDQKSCYTIYGFLYYGYPMKDSIPCDNPYESRNALNNPTSYSPLEQHSYYQPQPLENTIEEPIEDNIELDEDDFDDIDYDSKIRETILEKDPEIARRVKFIEDQIRFGNPKMLALLDRQKQDGKKISWEDIERDTLELPIDDEEYIDPSDSLDLNNFHI